MDLKTKIAPTSLSAQEMDEDQPSGFIGITMLGIILGITTAFEWIVQSFQELPAWARDNFGLMVFFSVSGVVVLPEMNYFWIGAFALPLGFSIFAMGFLSIVEQADPRGDMFENDASMWARRSCVLALPTAALIAIAAIR